VPDLLRQTPGFALNILSLREGCSVGGGTITRRRFGYFCTTAGLIDLSRLPSSVRIIFNQSSLLQSWNRNSLDLVYVTGFSFRMLSASGKPVVPGRFSLEV
jgi:hypothetical protein